jgi:hypothetical protein
VEQHNVEVSEFDFGQLSLNLPHCAALQTDIEPRYPCTRFDTQWAVRFVLGSRYTTGIAENWPRDPTDTHPLSANWPRDPTDTHPLSAKWLRDTTDTHPLSANWPRDATSEPRAAWRSVTRLNCLVDFNEISCSLSLRKVIEQDRVPYVQWLTLIVYRWRDGIVARCTYCLTDTIHHLVSVSSCEFRESQYNAICTSLKGITEFLHASSALFVRCV